MPTPFCRIGRQMGNGVGPLRDLCLTLFLHLIVFKYVHCTFLLSVVLPSIICSSDQSFGSIQLCIVVILCPSPSAACSVSTSLFFFVRWLPNPENCVLSVFHLFVYSISWDHIKLPSQYFKNGRMELLKPVILSGVGWGLRKVYCGRVATLQHLL